MKIKANEQSESCIPNHLEDGRWQNEKVMLHVQTIFVFGPRVENELEIAVTVSVTCSEVIGVDRGNETIGVNEGEC